MNLPKLLSSKKKEKHYTNDNVLESLTGVVRSTVDQVKVNADGVAHDTWNQLLIPQEDHNEGGHSSSHGVLEEGHEFDLGSLHEKAHAVTEAGQKYMREITHAGERADAKHSQEVEVRLHQIMIEIKQLTESSGELKQKVEVIAMEQTGEQVGIYHLNFLDKMLSFIHELRMSVDDSLAWFSAINGKKQARQYKSMAKKHGTSFTMNNERQVATSVG